SADSGYEVLLDVDPVASMCVLGHVRRRGDVLDPVSKPARHCPPLARLWNTRRVTQFLQLADLADNFGLLLAHDVAAVGTTVVAYTHGYPAVPVAVASQIDTRGATWRSGGLVAGHQVRAYAAGAMDRASWRSFVTYSARHSSGTLRKRPTVTVSTAPVETRR